MWRSKCSVCEAKDAEISRLSSERDRLLEIIVKLTEQGVSAKREIRLAPQPDSQRISAPVKGDGLSDGLPKFRGEPRFPIWGKDLALGGHLRLPVDLTNPDAEVAQIDE
jgi:hypothetical protein